MEKSLGEKAKRTRQHILAQGIALMQEKGFRDTSIRDICEAAEVSVGTFYAYFRDKGELFRYQFQEKDDSFAHFLNMSITGDTTLEKINSFCRYYAWLNIGTGRKELENIFLCPGANYFPTNNPAYHVLYEIIREGQRSGEITAEPETDRITDMFRVFLRGCVYEWVMGGCIYDLEEQICSYVGQLACSFIPAPSP